MLLELKRWVIPPGHQALLGERRNLVPCPYEVLTPIRGEEIAKSLTPLSPCSTHTANPTLYHF
jgi:hypothetical protein